MKPATELLSQLLKMADDTREELSYYETDGEPDPNQ
jgi:hypothetical protein